MVTTTDLVAYYKCDTDGTFVDSHASYDGTINGATFTTDGKINGGYDYDGNNDDVDTNILNENINDPTDTQASISLWFKVRSGVLPDILRIFDTQATSSGYTGLTAFFNDTNGFRVQCRTEDHRYQSDYNTSLSDDTWYHLVVTIDDSGGNEILKSYINGALDTTTTPTSETNTSQANRHLIIANRPVSPNAPFNGIIDEISVWNRALSEQDITDLYNGGTGLQYPFTPTPTGTNMSINIGDVWKDVESLKINIGDSWKDVVSVKQNIGDTWKDVF